MAKENFLDAVANAFSEAKAWKASTLALGIVSGLLTMGLLYKASDQNVILIPHNVAANEGRMVVDPNKPLNSSAEYLQSLAISDLALILNWTPETVTKQYQRFLNRTTEDLYARENIRLLTEAREHEKAVVTQTFVPKDVRLDLANKRVVADGFLIRWTGDKETIRIKATFIVTYQQHRGYLHVSNLELKK